MFKRRKWKLLKCAILLSGAFGLTSPSVAQSSSNSPTEARASLSNGLRAGMSAAEVATIINNLPDVASAKASGSKKNPSIKVKYVNEFANLDGFDFEFAFSFLHGKLFYVDLISRPICDNSIVNIRTDLVAKFSRLYGPPDASGVFHKNNTDVYLLQRAQLRTTYRGNAALEADIARIEAGTVLKCGGGWLQKLTVRFIEKVTYMPAPIDAATAARIATEAQRAREDEVAKNKSDAERLSLPQ